MRPNGTQKLAPLSRVLLACHYVIVFHMLALHKIRRYKSLKSLRKKDRKISYFEEGDTYRFWVFIENNFFENHRNFL